MGLRDPSSGASTATESTVGAYVATAGAKCTRRDVVVAAALLAEASAADAEAAGDGAASHAAAGSSAGRVDEAGTFIILSLMAKNCLAGSGLVKKSAKLSSVFT